MARHLKDTGRFVEVEKGVYKQRRARGSIGAGIFRVKVGDRSFACLRALDVGGELSEEGMLVEAFLDRKGRSVLFRRYNGRKWKTEEGKPDWTEKLPDDSRIVVDGVTFVHWYDCLTDTACEIDPQQLAENTPADRRRSAGITPKGP